MAGYLSSLEQTTFSVKNLSQAMVRGSVVASFTCEAFSTQKLQAVTREDIDQRLAALHQLGNWDL